ncbi:MAG: redoxin domain-containing protein [Acidobacteria bacterium]|nr:redoxin domain-containing protein [Acidobacteriota bacterium]MBI3473353.1 redoxin domain-containing protein [Candidatus Solibacter usitatus]
MRSSLGRRFLLVAPLLAWAQEPAAVDLAGTPADPFRGNQIHVLLFLRTDCPISNRYAPEIQRLHQRYAPAGVRFWMVYPNREEPVEAIRRHAAEYNLPGQILRDPHQTLVKKTGARVTPEAAVYAADGRLVYRGRIDDRYVDLGKSRPAAARHDLAAAIDAALAGKPAAHKTTRAVGCFISGLR